jgi:DedD protein
MSHFVVTRQQFHQYIVYAVLGVLISFGFGYWVGTESVVMHKVTRLLPASKIDSAVHTDEQDVMSSTPVETPQSVVSADVKPAKPQEPAKVATVASPAAAVIAPKPAQPSASAPVDVIKPAAVTQPVVSKPVAPAASPVAVTKPVAVPPAPVVPVAPQTAVAAPEPVASTEPASLFAVQVGVFSSQENATKLVDELNAKGFEAYAEEFVAETGETKFNVRFGRSSDRDFVQKKLTRYKQIYSSSAYIITLK